MNPYPPICNASPRGLPGEMNLRVRLTGKLNDEPTQAIAGKEHTCDVSRPLECGAAVDQPQEQHTENQPFEQSLVKLRGMSSAKANHVGQDCAAAPGNATPQGKSVCRPQSSAFTKFASRPSIKPGGTVCAIRSAA